MSDDGALGDRALPPKVAACSEGELMVSMGVSGAMCQGAHLKKWEGQREGKTLSGSLLLTPCFSRVSGAVVRLRTASVVCRREKTAEAVEISGLRSTPS